MPQFVAQGLGHLVALACMARTIDTQAIAKLSVEQRLKLIEQIWDTLERRDDEPFSDAQWAETRRRLDNYRRNPGSALNYDQYKALVRSLT